MQNILDPQAALRLLDELQGEWSRDDAGRQSAEHRPDAMKAAGEA